MRLSHCFILVTLLPFCSARYTLPTFLIDYDQVMNHLIVDQSPFTRTHVTRFANIIEDAVTQSSVIIIFVEERLCTEDISLKDEKGTAFPYLREQLMSYKLKYYPKVVGPLLLLTRLLEPTELNVYVLKPGEVFRPTANLRYFYVFFQDGRNETRASALRRHDKIMQDVYESVRKITDGAIVGFYTAKMNPMRSSKYGYAPTDVVFGKDRSDVTMASLGALIRFKGLTVDHGRGPTRRATADLEIIPRILEDQQTDKRSITRVAVGMFYMEFVFDYEGEFWILDTIKLFEDDAVVGLVGTKEHLRIKVPVHQSYFCDEPLVFYNKYDRGSVIIPVWQIQPFRKADVPPVPKPPPPPITTTTPDLWQWFVQVIVTLLNLGGGGGGGADEDDDESFWVDETFLEFGKPLRCTRYFTIEILSGLMVFSIFLFVIIIAIYCLFSIESNDRFDDPYGKKFHTATFELELTH